MTQAESHERLNNQDLSHWFALYTQPRAEKQVQKRLEEQGFETYLPINRRLKQWSDRKKWVEEPLFRSYIFINTILELNYYNIINTNGVVKFVGLADKATPIPESQIHLVKSLLANYDDIEGTDELLIPGSEIEVIAGPLLGMKGILVSFKGTQRVAVKFEQLDCTLVIQLPANIVRICEAASFAVSSTY